MNFEFHAQTHTGLVRKNNEDAVAVDCVNQLAVLADGMGGYNAGEVASALATECICTELGRWLAQMGDTASDLEFQQAMTACVDKANLIIFNEANNNLPCAGMGTTLVMGVFQGSRGFIGHVGDSRCYRLRGGSLQLLTRDHSLLQEQIDAGLISPAQAQYAPQRNLITRALGIEDAVQLEVREFEVQDDDLYLFCSDGLSDMLTADSMTSILLDVDSLCDKATALISEANACGGRDNISVILVQREMKSLRKKVSSH